MDVRPTGEAGMHWYLSGRDAGMYYVAAFEMEGRSSAGRGMIGRSDLFEAKSKFRMSRASSSAGLVHVGHALRTQH
jgi:hypothetical protein